MSVAKNGRQLRSLNSVHRAAGSGYYGGAEA